MRPSTLRRAIRASMIAVAIAAIAWTTLRPLLMRPYPTLGFINGGRLSQCWSDDSSTSHPDGVGPTRRGGVLGPLRWLEWRDGSYSLHLHQKWPPPRRPRPRLDDEEARLGVPKVGSAPLF